MTDPTLAALSAAIAAHPDEPVPREQYKDGLQEIADEGDEDARARLAFVRCQEAIPALKAAGHGDACEVVNGLRRRNGIGSQALPHCNECQDLQFFEHRERELLAAHEHEWRRIGVCEACGGEGSCEDWKAHTSSLCLTCGGTGDVGGLLLPPLPSQVLNTGEHWRHRVDFVRGHITTVYATLAEVFKRRRFKCGQCGDSEPNLMSDTCPRCGSSELQSPGDWHPTPRAMAWVRAFPVTGVVLTDRVPYHIGYGHAWFNADRLRPNLSVPSDCQLPSVIFAALPQEPHGGRAANGRYVVDERFVAEPTRDLATAALSRAVAQVLRAHVARRTGGGSDEM
ncbi:hypothetical protein VT84_13925 [Gemmata sp. SH-PL17]|uniref:hypothetical protein n=1 Tax=Gemmata sp. SH-PL17 TaxID=1630693 RepID=UPI00078BFEDE|nr:hypothetical protein [Gemmata sp. SH-PL17]AMV25492.1 hypothetical protein VT84_13925 [Gemmata sp. SH-PL17]